MNLHLKPFLLIIFFVIHFTFPSQAQSKNDAKDDVIQLSLEKWQWMGDKDIAKLTTLFHPQAKFVHMSGTWTTPRELEIIKSGSIWYKNAEVHDTAIEIVGNISIVWNRITLTAVVGGNEVVNEFTVTEVYQKEGSVWKMLALTFSSVRDTHQIEK